jgi:hypothetical protein
MSLTDEMTRMDSGRGTETNDVGLSYSSEASVNGVGDLLEGVGPGERRVDAGGSEVGVSVEAFLEFDSSAEVVDHLESRSEKGREGRSKPMFGIRMERQTNEPLAEKCTS